MADLPILFKAEMVNALCAGRKTQTRRLLSPDWLRIGRDDGYRQAPKDVFHAITRTAMNFRKIGDVWSWETEPGLESMAVKTVWTGRTKVTTGDTLWVKETWQAGNTGNGPCVAYRANYDRWYPRDDTPGNEPFDYDAHPTTAWQCGYWIPDVEAKGPWSSPLHMPRWASRITLKVTETRIERLLDITEDDALAEGIVGLSKDGKLVKYGIPDRDGLPGQDDDGWPWHEWQLTARDAYLKLFDGINDHGPGSMLSTTNPWVVATTFEVQQ